MLYALSIILALIANNAHAISVPSRMVGIDSLGRIAACGRSFDGTTFNMAVVRYLTTGQLDATFGTINGTGHFFPGMTTIDFRSANDNANSLVIDPVSRISIAGFAGIPILNPVTQVAEVHNAFALARLLVNGEFDPTFNPLSAFSASRPGTVITIIGQTSEANGVILDTTSKLVAAGFSTISEDTFDNFTVARYNSDGSLDATFGGSGIVTTDFEADTVAYGITQDSSSKYVVVGTMEDESLIIARYNTDGTLDITLDPLSDLPGTVQVDVTDPDTGEQLSTIGYSVIIDNNNKILTAGVGYSDSSAALVLVRFNPDGELDDTFGFEGVQLIPITRANVIVDALSIDANNQILVSALSRNLDGSNTNLTDPFTVFRLNDDGTLDDTFTPHNLEVTASDSEQIENEISVKNSVIIDAMGRVLVAGFYLQSRNQNIMTLARYLPNGAFDLTFNPTGLEPGIVITNLFFGPSNPSRMVQIGLLGSIFVSKASFNNVNFDMAVAKYTTDGTLDIFFGRPDLVRIFLQFANSTNLLDPTLINTVFTRLIGSGLVSPEVEAQLRIALGRRETTLANPPVLGVVTVDILGGNDVANSLILDEANNIVLAGYATIPDTSLTSTTGVTNLANDLIITATNELVQSATSSIGSGAADLQTTSTEVHQFAIVRLLPNGTLDDDFEPTDEEETESFKPGTIVTEIEHTSEANAIILDINNNYVLAGFSNEGGDEFDNVTLVRYLNNGSRDKSFGTTGDGIVISEFEEDTVAYGLTEDFDNKLVITGSINFERILVARYLPNGTLDTTFNPTGEKPGSVDTPIARFFAEGYTVLIDRSGRILVAGIAQSPLEVNLVVLRYFGDGSLDTSFGPDGNGIRIIPVPYFNIVVDSLAVDQQDKIVVTAICRNTDVTLKSAFNFAEPFVVTRLNTDGSDDTSFHKHGFIPLPEAGLPPTPQRAGIGDDQFTMLDNSVIIAPDNKILVAGFFNETRKRNNILVARYLQNGDFDPTFSPFGQDVDRLVNTGQTESSSFLPPGIVLTNTFFDNLPTPPGGAPAIEDVAKLSTPTEQAQQKAIREKATAVTGIPVIDFPQNNFIIDTKTPKITGTGRPSGFISITIDGRTASFVPTDSLGNWEYTASLSDGKHTIMASNLDFKGKPIQDSIPVQFTVSIAPLQAPTITNPRPNSTVKSGTVEISGTAQPDISVPIFIDDALVTTVRSHGTGAWTYSADLKDGKHTVYAATSDGISKMSPYSPTISFEVQAGTNRPPVITGPTHNATIKTGKVVFTGSGSAAHTIVLMLNDKEIAQIQTTSKGDWEHTIFLGNGKYTASAYQLDKSKNKSRPSTHVTFTVDKRKRSAPAPATVPPIITEDSPIRGRSVADARITILIDEKPVKKITADQSGQWSFIFEINKFSPGEHTIGILANDKKTNRSWLSSQKIVVKK